MCTQKCLTRLAAQHGVARAENKTERKWVTWTGRDWSQSCYRGCRRLSLKEICVKSGRVWCRKAKQTNKHKLKVIHYVMTKWKLIRSKTENPCQNPHWASCLKLRWIVLHLMCVQQAGFSSVSVLKTEAEQCLDKPCSSDCMNFLSYVCLCHGACVCLCVVTVEADWWWQQTAVLKEGSEALSHTGH